MGWLSNGTAAYPAVYPSTSCNTSHAGIITRGPQGSLTERWDAYCYRLHGEGSRALLPLCPARGGGGRSGQFLQSFFSRI